MNKEEPKKETAIVKAGEEQVIKVEDYEDLLSIAERRTNQVASAIQASLKITTPQDWINQSGKPYLTHAGAEKVARLFGVKISNVDTKKVWADDTKGRYYIYKTTGTVSLPGNFDSIEALGTCSQRDKFFAFKDGQWKDTSEIDETNIMKASYSNFVVNGITHLLGLRNLTWEQLAVAHITPASVVKVEYGGKSAQKSEPTATKSTQKKATKKAQKVLAPEYVKKREEIWSILMEMTASAEEEALAVLETLSSFNVGGKTFSAKKLGDLTTEKWIDFTLKKVKAAHEQMKKDMAEVPDDKP